MKSTTYTILGALGATQVAGHAIFQDLWIAGTDFGSQCVRMPLSNSPVTNVMSDDVRCNVGTKPVGFKCPVQAGQIVTIEMHQQPGDRSCANQAIGGDHYGPVLAYLTKVPDSSTADGSTPWYKVFEDGWALAPSASVGDDDYWGTKDMNTCCGKLDVKIPEDTAPGDYLLRAEAIALHVASTTGGAQLYMSCYQLTINGTGGGTPSTVDFPGAYKASDPGLLINIHAAMSTYIVPGPTVYAGGNIQSAGSGCSDGLCMKTCSVGSGPTGTAVAVALNTGAAQASAGGGGAAAGTAGCAAGGQQYAAYAQCGGGNMGDGSCAQCPSGMTCQGNTYYMQCTP